jgi:ribosomal protein S1
VTAPVVEANRAGVVVDVGVRGFVPLSQLASLGAPDRPPVVTASRNAVRSLVGKDLTFEGHRGRPPAGSAHPF